MYLKEVGILIAQIGGTEAIKNLVSVTINTHIKPMLQNHADYKDNSLYLEECLTEYLEISYDRSMSMNTIVFKGIHKTIYDLYIPLSIITEEKKEYIINDTYLDCINKYNKILIVDTAGMGKSTLVKYLAIQVINNNDYIPILIELRKVDKSKEILEHILDQFELLDKKIDKKDLVKMLKRGKFLIFFDGYDEITNENKGDILDNLQKFIQIAGNNKYILTSRDENDLSCLGNFQRFSIKPLLINEAFSLIRKYDNNGTKSELLIERIKNDKQLNILKEFLVNPMLISLLYKTFEYKEELAYKKLGFYSQVYEALFNDHDKTKGSAYVHSKKSHLDSLDFEKLLRRIAFISLIKNQIEYNKQEFVEIINKCLENMIWVSTSAKDVLDDLTNAIPFFQKEGNDYKWIHKSFMEYFSAGYICYDNDKTDELFDKIIKSEKIHEYKNVIDFCYDMKPDIARKRWVYKCICDYITEYENKYEMETYKNYSQDLIDIRKYLSFAFEQSLVLYKNKQDLKKDIENILNRVKNKRFNNCHNNAIAFGEFPDIINYGVKNNNYIVDLLFHKKIDVFKVINIIEPKRTTLDVTYGEHYISDDALLKINTNKENFEYITYRLFSVINRNSILDYEKCKILKDKIEWEMDNMSDLVTEFDIL